jgi:hypothetical protein
MRMGVQSAKSVLLCFGNGWWADSRLSRLWKFGFNFMKVTLNWLKQYVDFNWSPEELTGRFTVRGFHRLLARRAKKK